MAINAVRLNPNMTFDQLVAALNENFAAIENSSRTTIIKDDTGKPRIIIGRLPDNTYGIVISKPGYDVTKLWQQ